jgi:hypothetical protein
MVEEEEQQVSDLPGKRPRWADAAPSFLCLTWTACFVRSVGPASQAGQGGTVTNADKVVGQVQGVQGGENGQDRQGRQAEGASET